jgi:hypothetical protein
VIPRSSVEEENDRAGAVRRAQLEEEIAPSELTWRGIAQRLGGSATGNAQSAKDRLNQRIQTSTGLDRLTAHGLRLTAHTGSRLTAPGSGLRPYGSRLTTYG